MASKNSAWLVGLVVGVLSSTVAAGVDAWIGGSRLRADGPVTFDQLVSQDLDGIVKIQTPIRNSGLRPGGVRSVEIKAYGSGSGLAIMDRDESRERLLPFQRSVHTTSLVLRRTGHPLPIGFRLTYFDTDGDEAFKKVVAIDCDEKSRRCEIASR